MIWKRSKNESGDIIYTTAMIERRYIITEFYSKLDNSDTAKRKGWKLNVVLPNRKQPKPIMTKDVRMVMPLKEAKQLAEDFEAFIPSYV